MADCASGIVCHVSSHCIVLQPSTGLARHTKGCPIACAPLFVRPDGCPYYFGKTAKEYMCKPKIRHSRLP